MIKDIKNKSKEELFEISNQIDKEIKLRNKSLIPKSELKKLQDLYSSIRVIEFNLNIPMQTQIRGSYDWEEAWNFDFSSHLEQYGDEDFTETHLKKYQPKIYKAVVETRKNMKNLKIALNRCAKKYNVSVDNIWNEYFEIANY